MKEPPKAYIPKQSLALKLISKEDTRNSWAQLHISYTNARSDCLQLSNEAYS